MAVRPQGRVQLRTPLGDSAMDDTADAVKVLFKTPDGGAGIVDDTADAVQVLLVDAAGTTVGQNYTAVTVFASAAKTATANSTDQVSPGAKGILLCLDVTTVTGDTPSMTVKLQRKYTVGTDYIDIAGAAFGAKTTTGTSELSLYPGITVAANVSLSDVIGLNWRAVATITGDTPSFTFSLSGYYIP